MSAMLRRACLLAVLSSTTLLLAETPFSGTFKMNQDKSKLTGEAIQFSGDPTGQMMYTAEGHTTKFKMDGQPYTTFSGATTRWKKVDDHTWEQQLERNGVQLGTGTWTLSSDGKTLTSEGKGTSPDGTAFDDTDVYTRTAGGSGLVGSWQDTKTKMETAPTISFEPKGDDGFVMGIPALKATADLKLDGKEVKPEGPTVPESLTVATTKTGPRSFDLVEKIKGQTIEKSQYKLSPDGKTILVTSMSPGMKQPTHEVWEKQ